MTFCLTWVLLWNTEQVKVFSCENKQCDARHKTILLLYLFRWSWVQEAPSCLRAQHKKMKKKELLTKGNMWLWAGNVKKLNRCVLWSKKCYENNKNDQINTTETKLHTEVLQTRRYTALPSLAAKQRFEVSVELHFQQHWSIKMLW